MTQEKLPHRKELCLQSDPITDISISNGVLIIFSYTLIIAYTIPSQIVWPTFLTYPQ